MQADGFKLSLDKEMEKQSRFAANSSQQIENVYELQSLERMPPNKSKQSAWTVPVIILTVLMCLALMLLIGVLCLILIRDQHHDDTNEVSSSNSDTCSARTATLLASCKEIKQEQPNSPSGVYLLVTANGTSSYYTYCNMEELCGSGGGWTRLAYLNMSDGSQNCPSGLQYYSSAGLRTCGKKNTTGATCDSVQFSSNGISYSQVCGRIVGYQYGTPDAVHPSTQNIDSVYLDGVSITHGGSPRQHIWSLLVGVHSNKSYFDNCPCAGGSSPQSFIGNDYFCESANPTDSWDPVFYSTDPLWDGKGCDAAEAGCCSDSRLPWFNKTLNPATTDYLEMRVCVDQGTHTEDIKLTFYELYVK